MPYQGFNQEATPLRGPYGSPKGDLFMSATSLSLALLLLSAPTPPGAWILKCDVSPPGATPASAVRVFRLGPSLLQEWKPDTKAFGPNLCLSFQCKADSARLEGSIESPTVIFTITLDRAANEASWRTVGATGEARTSGVCTAEADKTQPAAALDDRTGS
jgi:hypothetical protein